MIGIRLGLLSCTKGASKPFYLLKSVFSMVLGQPVTFTHGQVLDTADEGMTVGSLVVTNNNPGAAYVKAENDRLVFQGTNVEDVVGLHTPTAISRERGRVFLFQIEAVEAITVVNLKLGPAANHLFSDKHYGIRMETNGWLYIAVGSSFWTTPIRYTYGTPYKFAIVLADPGAHFFVKGGAWSQWTLLHIDGERNDAEFYVGMGHKSATEHSRLYRIAASNVLFPTVLFPTYNEDFTGWCSLAETPMEDYDNDYALMNTNDTAAPLAGTGPVVVDAQDVAQAGSSMNVAAVKEWGSPNHRSVIVWTTDSNASSTTKNVLRAASNGNMWCYGIRSGEIYLDAHVDGVKTTYASAAHTTAAYTQYRLQAIAEGNMLILEVNGLKCQTENSYLNTATKHGFGAAQTMINDPAEYSSVKVYANNGYEELDNV